MVKQKIKSFNMLDKKRTCIFKSEDIDLFES